MSEAREFDERMKDRPRDGEKANDGDRENIGGGMMHDVYEVERIDDERRNVGEGIMRVHEVENASEVQNVDEGMQNGGVDGATGNIGVGMLNDLVDGAMGNPGGTRPRRH